MLGVFAEFETNLRHERQAEGITAVKQRGVYRGRSPRIDMDAAKGTRGCFFLGDATLVLGNSSLSVY